MLVGHKTILNDDRVTQARPAVGARILKLDEIDCIALTSVQNYLGMDIPKIEIRGRRSAIKLTSSFYTDRKLAELVRELQRRGVRVTRETMQWVDWASRH